MPKQRSPVEQTTLSKGLITEVSPLTFPPDASIDEVNFVIEKDGTRRRRLGMSYEAGYSVINSTVVPVADNDVVFNSYFWENAGGDPSLTVSVIQSGSVLKFFDSLSAPLTGSLLYTYDTGVSDSTLISLTVVDGLLIAATGEKEVLRFTYDTGVISVSTDILRIRDFFGVEDFDGSVDLTSGSGLTIRPTTLTDEHRYNLRNQSFAPPRFELLGASRTDTITQFRNAVSVFPSNSDNMNYALYANVAASPPTAERFHPGDLWGNPRGTRYAPQGYFIIDAMERGTSRVSEYAALLSNYSVLNYPLSSLPADTTPGGASVVAEFAGRVWYGGFSGEVVDGDSKSPLLSSYVMFSQLVNDPSDITNCYQSGDPTSKDDPDILDTDGGYLRISGAYGIVGFKSVGDTLLIIATNGVWLVTGGEVGFSATDYIVKKITDRGCTSPSSIIEAENGIAYWGDDGIYFVNKNEIGDYAAQSITQSTIQTYYDSITSLDKTSACGSYDSYEKKARWLYGNRLNAVDGVHELVFDVSTGAFSPNKIETISGNRPKPMCYIQTPPYQIGTVTDSVEASGVQVVVGVDLVGVTSNVLVEGVRELAYVTLLDDSATSELQYTVSSYKDSTFTDWIDYDSVGVDAAGYLVTGYLTGGDTQRDKSVTYLTVHMTRTEDGFESDGIGGLTPTNPSSCKIQTQWEWTNSANSNRWGREFQAYRYKRLYLPADINDPYDTGYSIITTKNKLRGHGRALSFKMRTEPLKDCKVLGWAMIIGVAGNV